MRKTVISIRFKPAWAGLSNNLYRFNKKEDIGDLEENEDLIFKLSIKNPFTVFLLLFQLIHRLHMV